MKFEKPSDVKVLYLGTPKIAIYPLLALLEEGFNVVGVVTQADKPNGRSGVLTPSPVKKIALKAGVPVFQPGKICKDYEWAKELGFDLIVCMAYGQIVPDELLKMAPLGAINFHGSLLPKYRGAAPMQRALMNGETETGVSLMEMVSKMDAGDVYDTSVIPLDSVANYSDLYEKMGLAAGEMAKKDVLKYANGELKGVPQDESKVTFAEKILVEDEHLPLALTCKETINYIKGLSYEPGAYLYLGNKKLKVLKASLFSEEMFHEVGEIVQNKKHLLLQLKDGVISLDEVQPEGKKVMAGNAFLNGARLVFPCHLK
ncbi:MAG: methionyl-tRNA formyltransferase [Bacilli bacterium]|nr:methionyl-tRNA formyltransferase [Bacilli bacterium]